MNSEGARVYKLESLLEKLGEQSQGAYFIDFLRIRHLEAGVIALKPGQEDTQSPHDSDELYYVVRGSGFMQLGAKQNQAVGPGSIVFVPAKVKHRFYGNQEELVVLYMFAEE